MPKLVIFESAEKARYMESLLARAAEAGAVPWHCTASGGHLTELVPDLSLCGIERTGDDACRAFSRRVWRNAKSAARLERTIRSSDEVYVASDPDREGESIAADIFRLARPSGVRTVRIRLHELTLESFLSALERPDGLDAGQVRAARIRSVVDWWIGMKLSRLVGFPTGRVQTPVLSMLRSVPPADVAPAPGPLTTWGLLRAMPNVEPDKIMERAQRLYSDGVLSYPRTDSLRLSPSSISRLCHAAGVPVPPEPLARRVSAALGARSVQDPLVQDAHEALHLVSEVPEELDPISRSICTKVVDGCLSALGYEPRNPEPNVSARKHRHRAWNYGALAATMQRAGIGRPSTAAGAVMGPIRHVQMASDLARDGTVRLELTEEGRRTLERVDEICPRLAKAEFTARMEERLRSLGEGAGPEEQNGLLLDTVQLVEEAEDAWVRSRTSRISMVPHFAASDFGAMDRSKEIVANPYEKQEEEVRYAPFYETDDGILN